MTPSTSQTRSRALLTPQSVPPNRAWPHLRSEVSRLTHRRLYRALAVILLLGIAAVSAIVFVNSSSTPTMTASGRAQYERDLAMWEQQFDQMHAEWQTCAAGAGGGADAERQCGPEPTLADGPRPEYYGARMPYVAEDKLPAVLIAVTMAGAMLAFVLGASSGGAEWSSRSMTLQLLWEPRRTRLLALKWVALGAVVAATALVAMIEGLALGALTAALRGRWATAGAEAAVPARLWSELGGTAGRGVVLVAVAASFGFAIAMLVRNTGAALGTGFVYFAVVENAVRLAFMRFGAEQYMLTTNVGAFVVPGGMEVPGRMVTTTEAGGRGSSYTEAVGVHLGNGRALLTLLVYLALVAVPAWWSFTRRDVS